MLKRISDSLSYRYGFSRIGPNKRFFETRLHLLKAYGIEIIVDGGANKGQWLGMVHKYFPDKKYVIIEPQEDCIEFIKLKYEFNKNFEFYNLAISSYIGEGDFFIASNSGASSSLNEPDRHLTTIPNVNFSKKTKVKVTTLDALRNWNDTNRLFLKLDLQGHEFAALQGAVKTLKKVEVIEIEGSFSPLYKGEVPFFKTLEFLYNFGFEHMISSEPRIGSDGKQWDFNSLLTKENI